MKNILFLLLISSLIGCSNSDTPDKVVLTFHDAIGHTDFAKAKTVAAPETIRFLESMEGIMKQLLSDEESKRKFDESNAKKIKEFEENAPYTCSCKEDGENKRTCEVKDKNGKVTMDNIKVEKMDEKWLVKISLFKE